MVGILLRDKIRDNIYCPTYMRLPKLSQQQGKQGKLPISFHFLLFNMQSSEDDVIQVELGMNCIVNTKVKSEIQVRVIGSSRQLLKPI
jgi:hypothetical protein